MKIAKFLLNHLIKLQDTTYMLTYKINIQKYYLIHLLKLTHGFAIEIPDGYFAGIFARSGLSIKEGLRPSNCVGVIDSDYRGEIIVSLYNDSDECRKILNNQRIAQLVIIPYLNVCFKQVDQLSETSRNDKGFGSSGK